MLSNSLALQDITFIFIYCWVTFLRPFSSLACQVSQKNKEAYVLFFPCVRENWGFVGHPYMREPLSSPFFLLSPTATNSDYGNCTKLDGKGMSVWRIGLIQRICRNGD